MAYREAAGGGGGGELKMVDVEQGVTTVTLEGLLPGTKYAIKARAVARVRREPLAPLNIRA